MRLFKGTSMIRPKWYQLILSRMFGEKVISFDGPTRVTSYHYKGKVYITDIGKWLTLQDIADRMTGDFHNDEIVKALTAHNPILDDAKWKPSNDSFLYDIASKGGG